MPSLWSRIKAAASIGNKDSWNNPTPTPVQQRPAQQKPRVNVAQLQSALNNQQQRQLSVRPVQKPKLNLALPSVPKVTGVTVAKPQNLTVGNKVITPTPNTQTAPTAVIRQAQQNVNKAMANRPSFQDPLSKFQQTVARDFVARPVTQIAASLVNPTRGNNNTVRPTNPVTKFILGDKPVQSVQAGVRSNYQQHPNLPAPARLALAGAYGAGQVLNDVPVAAAATKTATKGVKLTGEAAKNSTVAKTLTSNAPRVSVTDQQVLRDYADALSGAYKPKPSELSNLIANARQVGAKHGVDLTNGSMADRLDRATGVLDQVGKKRFSITPLNEVGAVGKDVRQAAKTRPVSSEQTPLQSLDQEGVKLLSKDTPINNNQKGNQLVTGGRAVQRQNKALQESPQISAQKELAQTNSQNLNVSSDSTIDPLQQIFDNNPVSATNTARQAKNIVSDVAKNEKINKQFAQDGAELPVYNTKLTNMRDKVFRSTRSVIERQGTHGQALAGDLQKARDTQEIYQSQILKQLPTVRKLSEKEFENFVNATQGNERALNTKVLKAIEEWQSVHPAIRDRAVNAGLEVGDLGPTYYPHFIDFDKIYKDKNTYNQAINHLVESGQAPNAQEAIKLLSFARDVSRNRRFGNLEASRMIDVPFYDKSKKSLTSYIQSSSKRIAQTETFGAKDEKALERIAAAGQEGYDTEAMKNAYDIAVGAKQYNPNASMASNGIRKYVTTTRLGLGALTNVMQNVNTGIVTGHIRTLNSMVKQLDPATRSFVEDTGTISDAVINDLKANTGYSTFTSKVLGKGLNLVTAPLFGKVEKFNRAVAATAGRDYALRLAQTGKEDVLRKLGVTGAIKNGTLTEAQQIQAARKVVEKTQFKVDPQDLPGWTDSPGGKLVSQFRTFSYNQSKFVSNEILKPLAKGNALPLGRLLASLPLGYAMYETKRAIAGRPEEENKTKLASQALQNVGGLGVVFDIYNSLNPIGSKYLPSDRRVSMAVGALGGPAAGVASQGVGAISEAIQRKNTPTDTSKLEGKLAVGKTPNDYTDLTALTRFGLQQVPVIGTATANRVLPYKKESNAAAGKSTAVTSSKPQDPVAASLQLVEEKKQQVKSGVASTLKQYGFSGQTEDTIKELAKTGDQNAKDALKSIEAIKKSFSSDTGSTPENVADLSPDIQKYYKTAQRLTSDGKEKWDKAQPNDSSSKALVEQVKSIKPSDAPDIPETNEVAGLYANYKSRQLAEGWSKTREDNEKGKLLREVYKTSLNKDEKYLFGSSSDEIYKSIQNGDVSKDTMDKLVTIDNAIVKLGGTAQISKKLRNALGYAAAPTKTSGLSGGKTIKVKPNLARTRVNIAAAPTAKPKTFRVSQAKAAVPTSYKPAKVKIKSA